MARVSKRLHREYVRHTIASIIAGAIACILVVAARIVLDVPVESDAIVATSLTLVFGAYGPAFLWLTHLAFRSLRGDQLRARLRRSEERNRLIRYLYLGGPASWAVSIVVVGMASVVLLATGGTTVDLWLIVRCVLGVAGTWVLLVAIFAVDHMRGWAEHEGTRFPGDDERTFGDFVYLSVQLSTTFSTSDVELTNGAARRLATVQSVVAFAYSSAIIAVFASLLISFAA